MSENVFMFSGQGSQYVGMAKELFDNFDGARSVFKTAGEVLGYDLAKIVFEGPDTELNKTVVSQPAIMAVSLCALEAMKANGIKCGAVAGQDVLHRGLVGYGVLDIPGVQGHQQLGKAVVIHSAPGAAHAAVGVFRCAPSPALDDVVRHLLGVHPQMGQAADSDHLGRLLCGQGGDGQGQRHDQRQREGDQFLHVPFLPL